MKDQSRDLPRISIITPCLNGEQFIVDTIESVVRQGYPNLEHIVVDGGSTDATLSLLRRYGYLTVISEPDRGSHEAMNKGIARATGDLIAFMNVDDTYPDDTLATIGAAFLTNPGSSYYEHICKRAGIKVHYCAEPFKNDGTIYAAIVKSIKRAMAAEYSRNCPSRSTRASPTSRGGVSMSGVAPPTACGACLSIARARPSIIFVPANTRIFNRIG
jgi:glycosyltransferase involved in cell wall biosynthesis